MGTPQHCFMARGNQASIQGELHPLRRKEQSPARQAGRLDALGHGDSPSEELGVKDNEGILFQGLSRDPSKLSDEAGDGASAMDKLEGGFWQRKQLPIPCGSPLHKVSERHNP